MIRRLPVLPTILVLAAVATMIGLGIWQIGRAQEKDARTATLAERMTLPPTTYPYDAPRDESLLYRTLRADCSQVLGWDALGGKDTRGLGALVTRAERDAKLMIVAEEAAAGLVPSAQPQPMAAEENSSWAYAGQWFFFALTALVIYGFALRSRLAGRK